MIEVPLRGLTRVASHEGFAGDMIRVNAAAVGPGDSFREAQEAVQAPLTAVGLAR